MPRSTSPVTLLRLDSLTGLRFFAAFMVLQHHFTNFAGIPHTVRFTGFGATGVTFFFILSGFVLTWSRSVGDTPGRFYWRRFARIWPLHAVTTLMAIPVMYSMRNVPYDWTGIGLSFVLLHAWVPSAGVYFAGNPASWSLSCEAFFYAVHPLIAHRIARWSLAILALASAGLMALLVIVADLAIDWPARFAGWLLYISPVFRLGEFLLGVALAVAVRRGFRIPIGVIPATLLVGAWFFAYYDTAPRFLSWDNRVLVANLNYAVLPLLYAGVIIATAQLDLSGRKSLLRTRPLILLGQWSYALYLVHAIVIYAMIEWVGVRPLGYANIGWLVLIGSLCIAISAVLYTLVEHPAEAWLKRLMRRPTMRPAATPELSAQPRPVASESARGG